MAFHVPLITIAMRLRVSDASSIPVSRMTFCRARGSILSGPSLAEYPTSSGVEHDPEVGCEVTPDLPFERFDDRVPAAARVHQDGQHRAKSMFGDVNGSDLLSRWLFKGRARQSQS